MKTIKPLVEKAKLASTCLSLLDPTQTKKVLQDMAEALILNQEIIFKLNKQDILNGQAMHLSTQAMDRLLLNTERIQDLAAMAIKLSTSQLPLQIKNNRSVNIKPPLLLSVIYESRPYISAEASMVAFASNHAIILRGGKEGFHSNTAIASILGDVLEQNNLPRELITLIPTSDRVAMTELIGITESVDYIIPRGSKGLVTYIKKNSKVPVITNLSHVHLSG